MAARDECRWGEIYEHVGDRLFQHYNSFVSIGADFPGLSRASKRMNKPGPEKEGKKSCRKKLDYNTRKMPNKPPLSYAALIALAICSTPQRMMTLSSIYRWIENTFPFYRSPEAKAWKVCTHHCCKGLAMWCILRH